MSDSIWNSVKEDIRKWYCDEDLTCAQVLQNLNNGHGFNTSTRSLKRHLKLWDFKKNAEYNFISLSKPTQDRIEDLWKITQREDQMLHTLKEEGFAVSAKQLGTWRRNNNMKRKLVNKEEAEKKLSECIADVENTLKSGQGLRYGRGLMQTHLRREGHRYSQHYIREALELVDPEGVRNRKARKEMIRVPFITDGPNHIWSTDGHDKLKHFGIQIYGAIDVYSRYIIWMYVGVSNRTAVSVVKQFLSAVRRLNVLPKRIRSDKGGETLQMGCCQYLFHLLEDPEVSFNQVYCYGTSKNNQRIESWWRQMLDRLTREWIRYFEQLIEDGLFSAGDTDIVSLLFIYMPIIRQQIHNFVETWNTHTIRSSKNRPHVVPGQPYLLYLGTQTRESKKSCGIKPNQNLLHELESVVKDYELDPYLTEEMENLCSSFLRRSGYNLPLLYSDGHEQAYKELRTFLWDHQKRGRNPEIKQLSTPTGNLDWIERHNMWVNKTQKKDIGIKTEVFEEFYSLPDLIENFKATYSEDEEDCDKAGKSEIKEDEG